LNHTCLPAGRLWFKSIYVLATYIPLKERNNTGPGFSRMMTGIQILMWKNKKFRFAMQHRSGMEKETEDEVKNKR